MPKSDIRIIIDTNLWVSFLLRKDLSQIDSLLVQKRATIIFSDELLAELLDVVYRPKFKKFFSNDNIDLVLSLINEVAKFIEVKSSVSICRDIKDNFLLALAIDGHVDYLLTGDKDLLELKTIEKTQILSISDYLK
ncbi:putative toxin-antitoxin system toxin component, PIN family [uncultured Mucilaginibacter sp.]|uniref:putative toxin-antitoxin system toxin component, PIN family n=1 Tax=uncultured Mucilaginibacter sp. TaxID=797541 RepID=UPI0025F2855B|nr:putative toxin-antitoxin system toxin component, PIN family [uncultured Mucilaginibacter sp.]